MYLRIKNDMEVQKAAPDKRRRENCMDSVPRFKEGDNLEEYVEILESCLLGYEILQEE